MPEHRHPELFREKLRQCCAVFNFVQPDPRHDEDKRQKVYALKDLINHIEEVEGVGQFGALEYQLLFQMVSGSLRLVCSIVCARERQAQRVVTRRSTALTPIS